MTNRVAIERPGLFERFLADELGHKGRLRIHVEAVQWRAENHFSPLIDRWRQPSSREAAQYMFVPKTTQFPPFRVQACRKIKNLFIEKRVTNLDGRMHCDAVALRLQ